MTLRKIILRLSLTLSLTGVFYIVGSNFFKSGTNASSPQKISEAPPISEPIVSQTNLANLDNSALVIQIHALQDENARLREQLAGVKELQTRETAGNLSLSQPVGLGAHEEKGDMQVLDEKFHSESFDADWSMSAQRDLAVFSQRAGFTLLTASCHSETCKVQIDDSDSEKLDKIGRLFGQYLPWAVTIAIDNPRDKGETGAIHLYFQRRT